MRSQVKNAKPSNRPGKKFTDNFLKRRQKNNAQRRAEQ